MKRIGVVLAVAALVAIGLGTAARVAAARVRAPRTFYVATDGSNHASGTSPAHPWRTVTRVDHAELRPGDRVLFRGGDTFGDQTLMPGRGSSVSGLPGHPITFGSYGTGRAILRRGIWISTGRHAARGPSWLTFEDLALGPVRGFQGVGSHITLRGLLISGLVGAQARQQTGIQTVGSHWTITRNVITDVGDSGILLGAASVPGGPPAGWFYAVTDNTIRDAGRNPGLGYPSHGIYVKVADAKVIGNDIVSFPEDGVSVRYQNADVSDNIIADGQIGIAWYQYGAGHGHSRFVDNRISHMSEAGIFVCGVRESCRRPTEAFDITGNRITDVTGRLLNLQPSAGGYVF